MSVEQSLQIPLSYDLPVNIQIRIEPQSTGYRFCIKSDWEEWTDFFLYHLTQHDVDDLNTKLQLAIQEVASAFEVEDAESSLCQEALLNLATKGAAAFNKIFRDNLRDTIQEMLTTGKIIQISSNDFSIPWELLYDGTLEEPVKLSHFWGMRYIISRNRILIGTRDAFVSPVLDACPHVGFVANTELAYVMEHEMALLRGLQQRGQIRLSLLRPLSADDRRTELGEFSKFLREEFQILHIACHAEEEEIRKDPNRLLSEVVLKEPQLIISDDFPVRMEDFDAGEFKLAYHPLVILNACLTGTLTTLRNSNWAVLFWERGARCVVATEFRVPDRFAARFIERLYANFLTGKPIGEALLTARRYFGLGIEHPNPLGLAYTLYSRLSVRIEKQKPSRQKLARTRHR